MPCTIADYHILCQELIHFQEYKVEQVTCFRQGRVLRFLMSLKKERWMELSNPCDWQKSVRIY